MSRLQSSLLTARRNTLTRSLGPNDRRMVRSHGRASYSMKPDRVRRFWRASLKAYCERTHSARLSAVRVSWKAHGVHQGHLALRAERKLGGRVESAHRGTQKNYGDYSLDPLHLFCSRSGVQSQGTWRSTEAANNVTLSIPGFQALILPRLRCSYWMRPSGMTRSTRRRLPPHW